MIKTYLQEWFLSLQKRICGCLESFEDKNRFILTSWESPHMVGGGTMGILRGDVFEKAGVNISSVSGEFSKEFQKEIPGALEDPSFFACGLSLVIHPFNPFVPIVHMNTRFIMTTHAWFGGGADLTPVIPFEEDTKDFHKIFENVSENYEKGSYMTFKKACDDYFYLPHRQEARGVGGIFYDYLRPLEKGLELTVQMGEAFLKIYPEIVERRFKTSFNALDREKQLIKRGRYVEFNLLYDRGTRFGLQTGGCTEAILMSLPPLAKWS